MDHNISIWLKDHLGMTQMCEADLNGLMFHNTHGGLCRRFIGFLAASTLCSSKYPHVYAQEKYSETLVELKRKEQNLQEALKHLEAYTKENENEERELSFLELKLTYLKNLRDLRRTSAEAFQEFLNRPNLGDQQVVRSIEKNDYTTRSTLETVYSVVDLDKLETTFSTRQIASLDNRMKSTVRKINLIHSAITKTYLSITSQMDIVDETLQLKNTNIQNLVALHDPEFEEISLDPDLEEKELRDKNEDLCSKISDLNQNVTELASRYKVEKTNVYKQYKKQIKNCLESMANLRELELKVAK